MPDALFSIDRDADRGFVDLRLRNDAVEVIASTVAVQQLCFFSQQQPVTGASIDVALQCSSIVEDLAATFEQVRDGAHVGIFQPES